MAARNLLVKTKLEAFREWIKSKTHARIEKTKGDYECLRFRINDTVHIVFENNKSVHLSIQSKTIYLVQQFLEDSRTPRGEKRDPVRRVAEE